MLKIGYLILEIFFKLALGFNNKSLKILSFFKKKVLSLDNIIKIALL